MMEQNENIEIALNLENINFSYNKNLRASKTVSSAQAVRTIENCSLAVEKGSFTTLFGPSGCGKSTLLKLISGFLEPDNGKIELFGENQKGIDVENRKIGMVFQDYALFPHMTVRQNIAYGLKIKKDKNIEEKIAEVAENLDISSLLDRFPAELSGGQQQRVALARSLILNPKILLMDEPLSSLDAKLREKVRTELRAIQQKLKITTIYVTHDQVEALSLSDKIAVMNGGKILQYDTPRNLFFKPQDKFSANFVGGADFIELNGETFVIRPQWYSLNKNENAGDITGKVLATAFLGDTTRFTIQTESVKGQQYASVITADLLTLDTNSLEEGSKISVNIDHMWKLN